MKIDHPDADATSGRHPWTVPPGRLRRDFLANDVRPGLGLCGR